MSLNAFLWASRLPLDVVGPTAYRVLMIFADHANSDGRNAFREPAKVAGELGCSRRTVERSLKELRMAALIRPGDQRFVQHLRADRRPTVYDLNLDYGKQQTEPNELDYGPTEVIHNGPTRPDSHGPTNLSRPDNQRHHGPTTVVALRTKNEPVKNLNTQSNHRAAVGPCGHPMLDDRHCIFGCHPVEVHA